MVGVDEAGQTSAAGQIHDRATIVLDARGWSESGDSVSFDSDRYILSACIRDAVEQRLAGQALLPALQGHLWRRRPDPDPAAGSTRDGFLSAAGS